MKLAQIASFIVVALLCLAAGWFARGYWPVGVPTPPISKDLPDTDGNQSQPNTAPSDSAYLANSKRPEPPANSNSDPTPAEVKQARGKYRIGLPKIAQKPDLTATGYGVAKRLDLQDHLSWRYTGDICDSQREAKILTRRVHGIVYEEDEDNRCLYPLAGATVYESKFRYRTITDENGRFEMETCFSDERSSGDLDLNAANDVVTLGARIDGYIGPRSLSFRNPELDSDLGCVIWMSKTATITVSCSLAEPVADPLGVRYTIWVTGGPEVGFDESRFVSMQANSEGKAEFGVPRGSTWLIDANAKGLTLSMVRKRGDAYFSANAYVFQPMVEETTEVAGTVFDLRTRLPIAGARIEFPSPPACTFSDIDGRFIIHLPRSKWNGGGNSHHFSVSRAYYGAIRLPIPEIKTMQDEFGALSVDEKSESLTELVVSMRPLVRVEGVVLPTSIKFSEDAHVDLRCAFGFADCVPSPYSLRGIAVDGTGQFTSALFPWGRTLAGFSQGGGQTLQQLVFTIDEACWKQDGPFRLELREQVK